MSLDKSSTSASVRVVPGSLAGLVITPDNYRTRAQVGYAIRFSIVNPVGTGDGVQLVLPETIGVVGLPQMSGGNVARGAIVTYGQATRTIKITKCFTSEIAAGGMISFSVKTLLNPPSTETSGAIKVSTIDATSGRIIDSDEVSSKIAATANEIPSVTVAACSDPQVRTGSYTG